LLHNIRIMCYRLLFALVLVSSTAVACSGQISSPVSPSSAPGSLALTAEQLSGTWTLSSIQPAGEAEQPTPAGAAYTLTFANGRLSTRADCNLCGGGFTVSDQTLTAGPALACTRAACPTMAFENVYTRILSGESTATVSEKSLVLSSSRGVLRFTR
jgi:heat shock protein HslJ